MLPVILVLGGFFGGFVDAIAGGGGLITLPVLIMAIGTPVDAIASNKIVGTVGAFIALLVYRRAGHLDWRKGVAFTAWVALGSLMGSSLSPWIPAHVLRWVIICVCPLILWVVWRKDSLVVEFKPRLDGGPTAKVSLPRLAAAGIACGFYDGAVGPGGGTFMFLGLLYVVKLPLLPAMAVTKLSNTFSAGTALCNFAISGHVHWAMGAMVASGMAVGAFIGAKYATRQAARIVRPVLTLVVVLLLLKLMVS